MCLLVFSQVATRYFVGSSRDGSDTPRIRDQNSKLVVREPSSACSCQLESELHVAGVKPDVGDHSCHDHHVFVARSG